MSEMSKRAREELKSKAKRMVEATHGKVDASDFTPASEMENFAQTGPRVISKRPTFKRGGSIVPHGTYTSIRADRKRRASGGSAGDSFENRNIKTANESRVGVKHDGGMAHGGSCGCAKCSGGRVKKAFGGQTTTNGEWSSSMNPSKDAKRLAESAMKMTSKKGTDPYDSQPAQASAYRQLWNMKKGRPGRAAGGKAADMGGERPKGGRIAKASGGASLADRMNAQILPTPSERPSRAKRKAGTNITIVIPQAKQAVPMPMARPPMMPPGGPPGMHQGAPPMPPPQGMPPPGGMAPPPGGPPPMMRKAGGRAYPLKDGGGGAKGRLQKIKAYGATP